MGKHQVLQGMALCAGLALAGCQWVLPFGEREPVAPDGTGVDGSPSDSAADSVVDGPVPDGPPDPRIDGQIPPPDTHEDPCQQLGINPAASSCADQCAQSCSEDVDGDGLPGERDPQLTCNSLVGHESCNATSTTWTALQGSPLAQGCGVWQIAAPQTLARQAGASLPLKHLVEVKLALAGAGPLDNDWDVGIWTDRSTSPHYACTLWRDPVHQPGGGLKLYCYGNGCKSPETFDGTVSLLGSGPTFYLQTYHDGTRQHCRLLDASGLLLQELTLGGVLPQIAGAVELETNKRDIDVDHIWIFGVN